VTALSFAGLVLSQSWMRGSSPLESVGAPAWLVIVPSLTWSATVTALSTLASKLIYARVASVAHAARRPRGEARQATMRLPRTFFSDFLRYRTWTPTATPGHPNTVTSDISRSSKR
jgi:hypothetical protein